MYITLNVNKAQVLREVYACVSETFMTAEKTGEMCSFIILFADAMIWKNFKKEYL